MAKHDAQKIEVAEQMGHDPEEVYGKPQSFQEETPEEAFAKVQQVADTALESAKQDKPLQYFMEREDKADTLQPILTKELINIMKQLNAIRNQLSEQLKGVQEHLSILDKDGASGMNVIGAKLGAVPNQIRQIALEVADYKNPNLRKDEK